MTQHKRLGTLTIAVLSLIVIAFLEHGTLCPVRQSRGADNWTKR